MLILANELMASRHEVMDSIFCKLKFLSIINDTVLPQPVFSHCYVRAKGYVVAIHMEP